MEQHDHFRMKEKLDSKPSLLKSWPIFQKIISTTTRTTFEPLIYFKTLASTISQDYALYYSYDHKKNVRRHYRSLKP